MSDIKLFRIDGEATAEVPARGVQVADAVEWSSPPLLCIAGDFTRYHGHVAKQIARNI